MFALYDEAEFLVRIMLKTARSEHQALRRELFVLLIGPDLGKAVRDKAAPDSVAAEIFDSFESSFGPIANDLRSRVLAGTISYIRNLLERMPA